MIAKVYRNIFVLYIILGLTIQSNAQLIDVIATSGGHFQGKTLTASFTIGETIIETLQSETGIISQGFQQPKLIVTAMNDYFNNPFTIQAYPNPTTDFVNLDTNIKLPSGSYYSITDIDGSLLIKREVDELTTRIPFQQLVPSVYFLNIYHQNKALKTFKIIKQ